MEVEINYTNQFSTRQIELIVRALAEYVAACPDEEHADALRLLSEYKEIWAKRQERDDE